MALSPISYAGNIIFHAIHIILIRHARWRTSGNPEFGSDDDPQHLAIQQVTAASPITHGTVGKCVKASCQETQSARLQ